MKTLATITTLALLAINSSAIAMPIMPPPPQDLRVLTYNLLTEGSKVSPKHVANFIGGSAEINYAANTVTLKLETAPSCPQGMMCAQMIQLKTVELPIVDITSDNECSLTVIAKHDMRPADGALEQIKIEDFTKSACKFFVKPISKVQYLTSYINRITGKTVTTISKLKADLVDVSVVPSADEVFKLTTGEYLSGFPKNQEVETGSILIGQDSVHLEIYNKSNCPMGAMCLVGPTVLINDFKVESSKFDGCAQVITAVNSKPGFSSRLEITNYANSPCDIAAEHLVVVEYFAHVVAPNAPKQHARFTFDYDLIPVQN